MKFRLDLRRVRFLLVVVHLNYEVSSSSFDKAVEGFRIQPPFHRVASIAHQFKIREFVAAALGERHIMVK